MPIQSEEERYKYGIRLTIIYAFVWFIDLLDASTLNVALPSIAKSFHILATEAEWVIIGFLLAMTLGMSVSNWLGDRFGGRRVFLLSQILYIGSSLGCGASPSIFALIVFRLLQGAAGGLMIPLGMTTLIRTMPKKHWAKTTARMNMVTLLAPAIGPLFAGYVTTWIGWRWLFFIKIPLSILCLFLSFYWVQTSEKEKMDRFDWLGFLTSSLCLTGLLIAFSEVSQPAFNYSLLIGLLILSLVCGVLFIKIERKAKAPLIPLKIFKIPLFSFGNIIQCAANVIFLGSNFLIALYLQKGLHFGIVTTGWVMSAITPGMVFALPLVAKFYNRLGPLPFIIPGLIVLSLCMFAFIFVTPQTTPLVVALLIFCEGAASSAAQTANVTSIFSEIPPKLMGSGSSIYSLFKQISASLGVALSTTILSVGIAAKGLSSISSSPELLPIFHLTFFILGVIPLLALVCCRYIDNKKALAHVKQTEHLPTESDYGAE